MNCEFRISHLLVPQLAAHSGKGQNYSCVLYLSSRGALSHIAHICTDHCPGAGLSRVISLPVCTVEMLIKILWYALATRLK